MLRSVLGNAGGLGALLGLRNGISAFLTRLFDGGSNTSQVANYADPTRLTPVNHWNGNWAWWAMSSAQLQGTRPQFLIAKANHYNMVAGEHLACWGQAADGDTWTEFDTVTIGASDLSFQTTGNFPAGQIYIAALPMYPFSRVQRKVGVWAASPRASQTPSSTNWIIGNTTSRSANDNSGRTVPALPIYGMKIGNASGYSKGKVIFTSGNHPSETSGRFVFEAAIDWLTGATPEAKFLCDWFDFYIYPCVNPQGVWAGYFRSSPQQPTYDHNRYWDSTGSLEEIDALKTAWTTDTGGAIDVGIDFHSWMDSWAVHGYVYALADAGPTAWNTAMTALDASYAMVADTTPSMLDNACFRAYGAYLAMTQEQGGATARGVPEWKTYGQNTMLALSKLLMQGNLPHGPGVGSRSFNGTTDRIDWASIFTPATTNPMSMACWAYLSRINTYQILINVGSSTDSTGISLAQNGTGAVGGIQFTVNGTTALYRLSTTNVVSTGNWVHIAATWDGSNNYNNIHVYVNGIEPAYTGGTNGVTLNVMSGRWSVGARYADNLRNTQGDIAQAGVWDRVLSGAEITALAAGKAPSFYPTNLRFYVPLNTASLTDTITTTVGTANGTSQLTGVGNGPSVIYP